MNDERIVVTDENFGDLLIQSAKDALAFARGDTTKGRVRVRTRITPPPPPPTYNADDIRKIRVKLGVSQHIFAQTLNVSDKTVKAWEQGVNPPSGPALRLLQIVETRPDALEVVSNPHPRPLSIAPKS